jgi:superoxide dismutase, Fe-Mn family
MTAASRREFLGAAGAAAAAAIFASKLNATEESIVMPTTTQDSRPAQIGQHTLPPLPYALDALEPHYDAKTLELHHDVHHKGYVDGLNKAEKDQDEMLRAAEKAGDKADFAKTKAICKALAFHGSGHLLHTIFWTNMAPKGGGEPDGELAKTVARDFGSYKGMKSLLVNAANSAEGSGWGILAHRKSDDRLLVLQIEKHENFVQLGTTPLLALDVWEHAYYLKYQNKRASWTEVFMNNLVSWADVGARLAKARG